MKLAKIEAFEPRQAFQRVARDNKRMEASDIHQFIGRFRDNQLITPDACHYIIRYWNETKKHVGLEMPKKEEGYLTVMDFT